SNGNYVVDSPDWNHNRGAVTWGNGTTGASGVVSASNSLVGSTGGTNGDQVGDGDGRGNGGITALSNGNYLVVSPIWNSGRGAVTWASGSSGATLDGLHTIDLQNSLAGNVTNRLGVSTPQAGPLPGSFIAAVPDRGGVVTVGFTDPNQLTA